MRKKKPLVEWGTFFIVTLGLYLIGHLFNIKSLQFYFKFEHGENYIDVVFRSFLPIVYGLVASIMAGFMYERSLRKKGLQITVPEDTKKNNGN